MEVLSAPLVQRLGYEPSKLETRVRLPDGADVSFALFLIKPMLFAYQKLKV